MTSLALAAILIRMGMPGATPADLYRARTLAATIQLAACRHGVEPALLAAVAAHETTFRRDHVGAKGERGIFQVLPATARHLGYLGSDEALAQDPINAGYAAAWLAHVRAVCARRGVTSEASWISKYRGDRCRPTAYSRAILAAANAARYPVATEAWERMGLTSALSRRTTTRKD